MYSVIKDSVVETPNEYLVVVRYVYTMDLDRLLADISTNYYYAKAILAASDKNSNIVESIKNNATNEQYREAALTASRNRKAMVSYLVFCVEKSDQALALFKETIAKNHPYLAIETNINNIVDAIALPTQIIKDCGAYVSVDTAVKVYPLKSILEDFSGKRYVVCELSDVESDEELMKLCSLDGVVKVFFNSRFLPKSKVSKRLTDRYQQTDAEIEDASRSDAPSPSFLGQKLHDLAKAISSTKQMKYVFETSKIALVEEDKYVDVVTRSAGAISRAMPTVVSEVGKEMSTNFLGIR